VRLTFAKADEVQYTFGDGKKMEQQMYRGCVEGESVRAEIADAVVA
jgi:hypothetical protein